MFCHFGVVSQLLDRHARDWTRRLEQQGSDGQQKDPTASAASPTINVTHTVAIFWHPQGPSRRLGG
jgi:hypothetical protein